MAQGGQYTKDPHRPNMSYKVVDVAAEDSPSGLPKRWVFTRNERERERQLETIERHLDLVSEELSRKPAKNLAHAKSVCGVVSHVSHKKYIKPSEKVLGAYIFDQDAIAWERRLAGVRLYRTTLTDLDGPAILQMYGELQHVEAMNKTLKHPLALPPCYHRAERRIRAHVMLTVIAANCALYLENQTGLSLEKLRALATGVMAHEVQQGTKRYWQRSEVSPAFEKALEPLGLTLPPIIWSEWIEPGAKTKKRKARTS
jgi:transposase